MPPTNLEPVSPELMLDTLDNGKLYLHSAHRTAIDLLLKQAGKADKSNNIAECRRCCTAILKFDIKYPPKHAFFPPTAGEPDAPESGAALPGEVPSSSVPATTHTSESPVAYSPSLREGAGERVPAPSDSPEPNDTSVSVTIPVQSTPSSVPSVLSALSPSPPPPPTTDIEASSVTQDSAPPLVTGHSEPPQTDPRDFNPLTTELIPCYDRRRLPRSFYQDPKPRRCGNYLAYLLAFFAIFLNSAPSFAAGVFPVTLPDQASCALRSLLTGIDVPSVLPRLPNSPSIRPINPPTPRIALCPPDSRGTLNASTPRPEGRPTEREHMRSPTIAVLSATVGLLAAAGSATASLTLLSGPQQGVHAGNLVTNGSFETGAPAPSGPANFWATGTTNTPFAVPGGWTSSGAPSTYASWYGTGGGPWYTQGSADLADQQAGLYFGNLFTTVDQTPTWNANGTVSFANTPTFSPTYGQACVLSQSVPTNTNIAAAYLLSFWVSGENARYASWVDGIFGLRVTNVLPGDPIQYLTTPGGQSSIGSSIRFEYQFTPINPLLPVTIEFINWGHLQTWPDASGAQVGSFTSELVLDDVIVNMIPTPGAGAIVALAGLAASRRRR